MKKVLCLCALSFFICGLAYPYGNNDPMEFSVRGHYEPKLEVEILDTYDNDQDTEIQVGDLQQGDNILENLVKIGFSSASPLKRETVHLRAENPEQLKFKWRYNMLSGNTHTGGDMWHGRRSWNANFKAGESLEIDGNVLVPEDTPAGNISRQFTVTVVESL
ncbi:MAG: hypothetical protein GF333_07815 [Candidatus Omnitrophica bacterium]|nr:hypothetical protein [Candidatus Omnitrophota bacterium]